MELWLANVREKNRSAKISLQFMNNISITEIIDETPLFLFSSQKVIVQLFSRNFSGVSVSSIAFYFFLM